MTASQDRRHTSASTGDSRSGKPCPPPHSCIVQGPTAHQRIVGRRRHVDVACGAALPWQHRLPARCQKLPRLWQHCCLARIFRPASTVDTHIPPVSRCSALASHDESTKISRDDRNTRARLAVDAGSAREFRGRSSASPAARRQVWCIRILGCSCSVISQMRMPVSWAVGIPTDARQVLLSSTGDWSRPRPSGCNGGERERERETERVRLKVKSERHVGCCLIRTESS